MLACMLDTSIAIYVIKRRPLAVLDRFNRHQERLALSAVVLAELLHEADKSSDPARNLAVVEDFVSRLVVLDYGAKAASHYGSIWASLERLGTPIGVNDLHIAAHARSEGLTLVSNNLREFERVPGLLTQNWVPEAADPA
jgi:tRNA(fMet)-specific endonuclease VapC